MPGIFGFAEINKKFDKTKQLTQMQIAMDIYPHFIIDDFFSDEAIAGSRIHLGRVGEKSSPFHLKNLTIWVEGEVYNINQVTKKFGINCENIAYLLLQAEEQGKLAQVLNKLDGDFCAALYDAEKKKIKLISDRYGMRVLYWYFKEGFFAWGSSVKAILGIDEIDKKLDQSSYDCFMDLGYLMGEHTWFEYIKLIKPATILEYDIAQNHVKQAYYWMWSDIKPSNLSFDEAVDKLGDLFIQAVNKRFNPNEKIGISLSGGLDSRAILAAVNHLYPDHKGYAYTFGTPNCDDLKIARKVIENVNSWKYDQFYFLAKNWFYPRLKKVWDSDGMLSIMHMHGSEFLEEISRNIDINLNGYAGDAVCGGSLITDINFQDVKPSRFLAKKIYGIHAEQYEDIFFDIPHFDNYLLMNRVRRFTNMGTINELTHIEQRKPFLDNDLIELIYSIPDSYRAENKLYSAMLQKKFPLFFKNIPWQKTGKPAGILIKPNLYMRVIRFVKKIFNKFVKLGANKSYTDYPTWLRDKENIVEFQNLLDSDSAFYRHLTDQNLAKKYLAPHILNKKTNNSELILRAVTVEIYLKRVLNGKAKN